jgi:ligand-binding sensor protein
MGVKVGSHWRFPARQVEESLADVSKVQGEQVKASVDVLLLSCTQPIQDVFTEVAGVGSVTTDKGGYPLNRINNSCDFCKLILGCEDGRRACIESWKNLAQQEESTPDFITCHAGLHYARARVEVGGEMVAILVAGQFYVQQPEAADEESCLHRLAKDYRINFALLSQATQRIPVLDEHKVSQISRWHNHSNKSPWRGRFDQRPATHFQSKYLKYLNLSGGYDVNFV